MAERNGFPYPGPDATDAPRMLVPSVLTLAVAFGLWIPRIWTRLRPVNTLGWDDYTVTVAILLALIETIISGVSCHYGIGRRSYYVDPADGKKALYYSFVGQPIDVWSICFAKVSVACMLLRIKRTKGWKVFLYIAIAIQFASALAAMIAQLVQCRPISAYWNKDLTTAKCWAPKDIQISAYVNASISIMTDVVFSLLPISFLRHMNRPLREKLVLAFLMGLGLVATVASILKMTLIGVYRNTKDPFWDIIPLSLWWELERNVSIIASCVPTLKAPFERVLRRCGLLSTQLDSRSNKGYVPYGENSGLQLGSLKTTVKGGEPREITDDGESEDSILRTERAAYSTSNRGHTKGISKTTEVHSSTEQLEADIEWNAGKNKGLRTPEVPKVPHETF